MSSAHKILPLLFRLSDKPLFGCYHEPLRNRLRECGVLICQPVGHEYVNSHRALRQLAARLADAGFPVLRFDYYGSGDSSGNTEETSVVQSLQDISTAISELRRRTGLFRVCMIGLRLGATLATLVAAQQGDVESMVLWDPVGDGEGYIKELRLLQKEMLQFRPKQWNNRKVNGHIELLGFPLSHGFITELETLNLSVIARSFTKNMLMLQSNSSISENHLQDFLCFSATHFEHRKLESPAIWLPTVDGSLLVPTQTLQAVVSWSSEIYS